MTSSTLQHDALRPKSADGTSRGLALATLVHLGLVVAIAFGVSWRASEPEGVEAELWAAVPQVAAKRDVAPDPTPPTPKPVPKVEPKPEPKPEPKVQQPDPQIAIEKAKQEKLKKQKQEEEKREREEKEKLDKKRAQEEKAKQQAKADAEQKKLDKIRDQNLARIKEMMGADTGSPTGKGATTAGPSAAYAGRIKARIKPNILLTDTIEGNPSAEVEVRCSPDGTIVSRKITKPSGVKEWDDAVLRAIDRTEILPRDTDGTVPSPMVIVFRPRDL